MVQDPAEQQGQRATPAAAHSTALPQRMQAASCKQGHIRPSARTGRVAVGQRYVSLTQRLELLCPRLSFHVRRHGHVLWRATAWQQRAAG